MNDIIKSENNPIEEMGKPHEGDVYYYETRGIFYKVQKIEDEQVYFLQSRDGKKWEKVDWSGVASVREITREHYIKLHLAPGESIQEAIASMETEMINRFIKPVIDHEEEESVSESTELMVVNNKAHYEEMAVTLEKQRTRIEIIQNMAKNRIEQFSNEARILSNRLSQVKKVIGMLETYLGVYEEILQIQSGQPASMDEKIHIRQLILYMDEEAGMVEVYRNNNKNDGAIKYDGFIHFANIEKFDEWLLQDNHLDIVLPEQKGIVALKPSRQDHYRNEDFWARAKKDAQNKMVYLLIRNGENIYRICTQMTMESTLFPTLEEAKRIEELFRNEETWGHDLREAKQSQETWLHNTLLIQGLFDRSSIFNPLPIPRIELTNPATYEGEGLVRMIRDGELTIADGHVSFRDWRKNLNENTKRGSRIYFPGLEWSKDGYSRRFPNFYSDRNNYPPIPDDGVYTIEEVKDKKYDSMGYHFLYLPGDKIWSPKRFDDYQDHDRKKRYMFSVYKEEFINYDDFEIEDIDYFLNSRLERRGYLKMIPVLVGLRNMRLEEIESEKAFVKLLSAKHNIPEEKLWELVDWWKKKVINKRPLSQDDSKAWRMIISRANSIDK